METIICIDYGTSMSKVAVSLDWDSPFPIPLGHCEGDPVNEFPIDSSLLFSSDGRIYFGSLAVRKSMEERAAPQRRLDSLKRRLTTGDQGDLAQIPLPRLFNQTQTEFSVADALALMFAHILRLTHDFLRTQYEDGVLDDVVYRFTRPVFPPERAEWVDRNMVAAIETGLKLEKRLGRSYDGSVDALQARKHLDAIASRPSGARISSKGLIEPVAAGLLLLSQKPNRRFLAAVVDIGAGTTDIALFAGVQPDGVPVVDRVRTQGTPVSVTKAGDYIDDLLRKLLEKETKAKLDARDRIEIELNIRRWKEDIFKFQETVPTLLGGRRLPRITLHRFIREEGFVALQEELVGSLLKVIASAAQVIDHYATFSQFPHTHIEVVPCGGGANLPIFGEIAKLRWTSRPSGRVLGFDVKKPVPADGGNYDETFPQLAVALGGALRNQPVVNGPNPYLEAA